MLMAAEPCFAENKKIATLNQIKHCVEKFYRWLTL